MERPKCGDCIYFVSDDMCRRNAPPARNDAGSEHPGELMPFAAWTHKESWCGEYMGINTSPEPWAFNDEKPDKPCLEGFDDFVERHIPKFDPEPDSD